MRRRVVVCLGLLLALVVLGDVTAMLCLYGSITDLRGLAESHRIQVLRADLASHGARLDRELLVHTIDGHWGEGTRHGESLRQFEDALAHCGSCHHEPQVQAGLTRVGRTYRAYRKAEERYLAPFNAESRESVAPEARNLADRLADETSDLVDQAAAHLTDKGAAATRSVHRAWIVLSAAMATVLVFGGIVAFYLKRRVTRPVEALLEGIERVGRGEPHQHLTVEGDEEFRALAAAFNQAHDEVTRAHEGVLQAEKMAAVGKFAAGIAHEVGNPLASISSIAQIMERQGDPPEQAERIRLILQQIDRISRVVRDLLTFSRPSSSDIQDHVQIGELLERATGLLGYDQRARDVRISCQVEADLQPVRGNADRLLLVFTNIMINALDAASSKERDTGELVIRARQREDRVEVRFQDNGCGMSQDQIASAFEPFYSTKEPGAGTGLGLWICFQVMQRHQAKIRIESRVDEGTTVILDIPSHPMAGSGIEREPADQEDRSDKFEPGPPSPRPGAGRSTRTPLVGEATKRPE